MFLNLSLLQFLALFGTVSAVAVALYLLDRTRRRQVVATLRFWVEPGQPAPVTRRRRIQQPLSLLLQLLGMALLLLAIAEFELGGRQSARRDHVLIVDTSAWMGAALPNRAGATLMDAARASALGWLRAVPESDRVLVVRADALATPATSWETDRKSIAKAIIESQPGATALNLTQSLDFARQLQLATGSQPGEIAYVGPGRISLRESNNLVLPAIPAFRVIHLDDSAIENWGLRSVGARRSGTDPGTWEVLVRVRNYGGATKNVSVTLSYGHVPEGIRALDLAPGAEREISFPVHTSAAGILEARLYPKDGFAADNYVALELPQVRTLPVTVYSDQPELIKPALLSDSRVIADFQPTAKYTPPLADRMVILHRFVPEPRPTAGNILWIDPPPDRSPVPVHERVEHPNGLRWIPDQTLTAGLRARDIQIEAASVFESKHNNDIRVAEVDEGPVIVASAPSDNDKRRMVVLGFDPFAGTMRFELATPLLLANILRWMSPDVFRDVDVGAQSAGPVSMSLTTDERNVRVFTDDGTNLPFNVRDRSVQFFDGLPQRVRVIAGNAERVYSLTLPELWDVKWTPPSSARRGIPAWSDSIRRNRDLWQFLAALGAALLIAEWVMYGRYSASRLRIIRPRLERAA